MSHMSPSGFHPSSRRLLSGLWLRGSRRNRDTRPRAAGSAQAWPDAVAFGLACALVAGWSLMVSSPVPVIALVVLLGVAALPPGRFWLLAPAVVALLGAAFLGVAPERIGALEQQVMKIALAAEIEILSGAALGLLLRWGRARTGNALGRGAGVAAAAFVLCLTVPVVQGQAAAAVGLPAAQVLPVDATGWVRLAGDHARLALAVGLAMLLPRGLVTPAARAPAKADPAPVPVARRIAADPDKPSGRVPAAWAVPLPSPEPSVTAQGKTPAQAARPAPAPERASEPAPEPANAADAPALSGPADEGLPVRFRTIVPADLLEDVKSGFDARAARTRVEIEILVGNGAFDRTRGDLHRIRAILENLARNALEHAGCSRLRLSYERLAGAGAPTGVWSVEDDGRGLPTTVAADLDNAVEFGLGLSIVTAAVTRLGGTIRVKTTPRSGTRYDIRLPETDPAAGADASQATPRVVPYPVRPRAAASDLPGSPAPAAATAQTQAHVLLVEDHPTLREVAGATLRRVVGRVTLAPDAMTGLTRFRADRPDLVIVDLVMPDTQGDVLVRALRAAAPDLPIIGMLSAPNAAESRRLTDAGASDVVIKPLGRAQVTALVRRHLNGKARGADLRAHG